MGGTLVIGGGGMVGQKLALSLGRDPLVNRPITLFDMMFPEKGAPGTQVVGNVTDKAAIAKVLEARPQTIFYLAAIVSGEAETDYDKGWQVNMVAFWNFLEAIREEQAARGAWKPKVIFTSSIAVFGPPFPQAIDDEFLCTPQTSYGAQKAASELMLNDVSRKGIIDGIAVRLPTICVRPGKANLAASSFFSGITREPLNGREAILPVGTDVRQWHASPRSAAGFLRHAAEMDLNRLEGRMALTLPGLSCTVEEQIEALRSVAGNDTVALIRFAPDEAIQKIVSGWPRRFAPDRALSLGFKAESTFREIIDVYLEDDMPSSRT